MAALRHDSLIVSPEGTPSLVATAHDVLEDWAILQWIEEQHLATEGSFKELSAAIGTHPAVRRSYRKWVADLVERNRAAADCLFNGAIAETEISGANFATTRLCPFSRRHRRRTSSSGMKPSSWPTTRSSSSG